MTGRSVQPSVTVAVLNHRRPNLLKRVLTAIEQLDYQSFEVVVVSDIKRLGDCGLPRRLSSMVRHVHYAKPNICRARNIAVGHAAGEIVAFIDDDAVPEPNWLTELTRPFASDTVATVGGVVRARNGLDMEWAGGAFNLSGREEPLALSGKMVVKTAAEQMGSEMFLAVRGVNSAFRRSAVMTAGGFDESIRYFLDETDLALRLARAGWSSAINPLAEVHHGLAENASRGRGRIRKPRNLFEIAASMAYFLRRHLPPHRLDGEVDAFRKSRLRDLDHHIRLGLVRGHERRSLLTQLESGINEGLKRRALIPLSARDRVHDFHPVVRQQPGTSLRIAMVTGWGANNILRLSSAAEWLADAGHQVSRFSYFSGTFPRWVAFQNGVWIHRGGTWRLDHRANRSWVIGRRSRSHAEIARVANVRRFDLILSTFARDADRDRASPRVFVPGFRQPLYARPAPGQFDVFDRALKSLSSECRIEFGEGRQENAGIAPGSTTTKQVSAVNG